MGMKLRAREQAHQVFRLQPDALMPHRPPEEDKYLGVELAAERYEAMIRLHLGPGIGHYKLQKLSPQHLRFAVNRAVGLHKSRTEAS